MSPGVARGSVPGVVSAETEGDVRAAAAQLGRPDQLKRRPGRDPRRVRHVAQTRAGRTVKRLCRLVIDEILRSGGSVDPPGGPRRACRGERVIPRRSGGHAPPVVRSPAPSSARSTHRGRSAASGRSCARFGGRGAACRARRGRPLVTCRVEPARPSRPGRGRRGRAAACRLRRAAVVCVVRCSRAVLRRLPCAQERTAAGCRTAARTAASHGHGGSAGRGSPRGFCRANRPYGNVPIRAIMGTLGLCHLGSRCPV
jgi:hypothetical protein